MSVKDVIKNSFLEGFGSNAPTLKVMILCLMAAVFLGLFIYLIYRINCLDSFYSSDFNVSLIMITVITCAIILTIQSSVVISLGMVGALSIVRFRTAVKSPTDLIFLFWAISIGIITGTSLIGLAVLLSAVLAVVILVFRRLPQPRRNTYFVSVEAQGSASIPSILSCVKEFDDHFRVRSENLSQDQLVMTIELRCKNTEALLEEIYHCDGVRLVNIISHGENGGI